MARNDLIQCHSDAHQYCYWSVCIKYVIFKTVYININSIGCYLRKNKQVSETDLNHPEMNCSMSIFPYLNRIYIKSI